MKFSTAFEHHGFKATPPGAPSREVVFYDSNCELLEVQIEHTDELIQANANSGNVELILQKFALGDDSYLNASPGFYGDVTSVQDVDIHTMNERYLESVRFYESLPDDIKSDFPTMEKFYENFSYDDWQKIINDSNPPAPSESDPSDSE